MNFYTVLIQDPSSLLLTVSDMKTYLRVDNSDEDDLIEELIEAATQEAEMFTRRSFLTKTYETRFDGFYNVMRLDHSPVISVSSIKYDSTSFDQDATLATTVYQVETGIEPARITLRDGQLWPETFKKKAAVRIRYTAGYSTVPKNIIRAVKSIVADWYEKREDGVRQLPQASERILWPYRVTEF